MKRNMYAWKDEVIAAKTKKPLPILTFPVIQLMGITVHELISSNRTQADAMRRLAEHNDWLAAVSMMDLSVEAEAFGSDVLVRDTEVPVVTDSIVSSMEDAQKLAVPAIGSGRTQIYIDALQMAAEQITDRPVLAGVIGPYSLAGRLIGTTQIMKDCRRKPDMVKLVLEKCTEFLIQYVNAYKAIGANGVVMAEPLTGLLSPQMAVEFSEPYVKRIIDSTQSEDFIVLYHNCGNCTTMMMDSLLRVGAKGYHFGNAIDMQKAAEACPPDILCMGNVRPAAFVFDEPSSIYEQTQQVMQACCQYPNYVISSGCDIPPIAKWANIDAFERAARDFYAGLHQPQ